MAYSCVGSEQFVRPESDLGESFGKAQSDIEVRR